MPTPTTYHGKRSWLREGQALAFSAPASGQTETPTQRAARTIPAAWLEELGAAGAVAVPIEISGAIIEGPLRLRDVEFQKPVSITDSAFTDAVDFSFSTFARNVAFSGCEFRAGLVCEGAEAKGRVLLDRAHFYGGAVNLADSRITGVLSADKVRCECDSRFSLARAHMDCGISLRGSCFAAEVDFGSADIGALAQFEGAVFGASISFNEVRIAGGAVFSLNPQKRLRAAIFNGDCDFMGLSLESGADFSWVHFTGTDASVSFDGAHAGNDLIFVGAKFAGNVTFRGIHVDGQIALLGALFLKNVGFNRADIHESLLFRAEKGVISRAARFAGRVDLINAQIHGNVDFKSCKFLSVQAEGAVLLDGASIEGNALFEESAFAGEASFKGMHVKGKAAFDGAHFAGKVSFDDACIEGIASFKGDPKRNPAEDFAGDVGFSNASFRGVAEFNGARFALPAAFVGVHFERDVDFSAAEFRRGADFSAAVADRDSNFRQTVFTGPANFREASFHVVYFMENLLESAPEDQKQFRAAADLRGFTYERIGVAWADLFGKLEPYDRQPYTQMEAAIRAAGDDRTADDIYYARRQSERRRMARKLKEAGVFTAGLPHYLFDVLQWGLFRYGIRPYRLLGFTLLILALGAAIFLLPKAVTNVDREQRASDPPSLTVKQAVGVSLKQFFPVEIPSGGRWQPTENSIPLPGLKIPFTAYATFHRAVGWVLVPLGVAALTGLLRRGAKASSPD